MKQLSKLSILLLLVTLCLCACDKHDDNDNDVICPPPFPTTNVSNFTGEVEFVVEAPQIKEKIEQDLTANPPFGGSKNYQLIIRKNAASIGATYELYAVNPQNEEEAYSYHMECVGEAEWKENYQLFPVGSGISGAWNKWNIVPTSTEDGKPVATYDAFIKQNIPGSMVGSKLYFCEDLTEAYRQKFPGEDIHAVVRRLVLTCVKSGDIVKD